MLFKENIILHGEELVKTWSDTYYIRQKETGMVYIDAIDIPNTYTYEETDIPLNA